MARQVEFVWRNMRGPECLEMPADQRHAEQFLAHLEQFSGTDLRQFETQLSVLKAETQTAQANAVQVMTIHKSKGLEFDVVILPGLERRTRGTDQPMLLWERIQLKQTFHLLMAPIHRRDELQDVLYQFLHRREQAREAEETKRLLYVAMTRARKRLFLIAEVILDEHDLKPPQYGSLLKLLWPSIGHTPVMQTHATIPAHNQPGELQRLPASFHRIEMKANSMSLGENRPQPWILEDTAARARGIVLHRYMAHWVGQDLAAVSREWPGALNSIRLQLLELGVQPGQTTTLAQQILQTGKQILSDKRAGWLLQKHQDDQVEYPLFFQGSKWILDRTFVDEAGSRWIVDYKYTDQITDAHRAQLQTYAKVWQACVQGQLPRVAIYLLMGPRWIEETY